MDSREIWKISTTINETVDENKNEGCIARIARSPLFAPFCFYEHRKEIKLFPIGFRDPMLQLEYQAYKRETVQTRLNYYMIVLFVYAVMVLAMSFFGAKELLPVKFGRLAIAVVAYSASYFLNMRYKYATSIIFALWLSSVGTINVLALSKTAGQVTYSGWAGELIGSENTMCMYLILMSIQNNANFSVLVLCPIYMLINAAMLYVVSKDIDDRQQQMVKIMSVSQRIITLMVVL